MSSELWMSVIEPGHCSLLPQRIVASIQLRAPVAKGKRDMTKTLDLITEIIRNPKHPFRQTEDRPAKEQKNRYERRKVKEFIKLGNWAPENTV
jgi:hypothetical protein